MPCRHLSVALAAGLLAACVHGQAGSSGPVAEAGPATDVEAMQLRQVLDADAEAILARHNVPSLAVAYLSSGEVQWTANYGEMAPGVPARADTLYNVASVTKAVVAESLMRLAVAGEIDLDAAMAADFVDPDLADDPRVRALTPALALTHRTGFAENWRSDMPDGQLAISTAPGTQTHYSGENFDYLVHFAEARLAQPFGEIATRTVFDPAGMRDSWFTPSPQWEDRVALVRRPDGTLDLPGRSAAPSGANNLHTTIGDMALFLRSAMHGQGLDAAMLARRQTIVDDQVEQACPPGIIPEDLCPQHTGHGLGWMVYDSGDNLFLLHNGKNRGERAIILFEPDRRYGVAVLTTGANGRGVISEVLQLLVPDERLNALVAAEARFDRH
ncbi:serine hydrolase domain-containing protein [Aurantiacibacter gilvus]|uniref:Serine hydrolase domain-containing protein n=1 Tax=Aurantiacibacter gilvus TaxID=3139141 RepID=A0ABU9IBV1_9SPHN